MILTLRWWTPGLDPHQRMSDSSSITQQQSKMDLTMQQFLAAQMQLRQDMSTNMTSMLRTMCGSRTGGGSLPCVMSDWQRCVDWFLAKYCRCKLRLDWCCCRWKASAKGHHQWGLQVWRRQVGFVRGTRWPAGSSAGRMVAWTARW
jgi:hypothetical protein